MSWEFLLTSMIVILVPGTGVLYTLACALSRGAAASVAAAVGCTLGILPHIAAAVFGIAALLHTSAALFTLVKFAGVAYLLYMAWQVLGERGTLQVETRLEARSAGKIALTGIVVNILNPKLSIFFLAFLPQFITPAAGNAVVQMITMGAVFMVLTLAVFLVYGLAAAAVRDQVISRPAIMRWLRRSFAAAFALLGVWLATADR